MNNRQIIDAIINLINTSKNYKAWLDPMPLSKHLTATASDNLIFTISSMDRGVADVPAYHKEAMSAVLDGTTLKLAEERFDLADPNCFDQIAERFECNLDGDPEFDPISIIAEAMD